MGGGAKPGGCGWELASAGVVTRASPARAVAHGRPARSRAQSSNRFYELKRRARARGSADENGASGSDENLPDEVAADALTHMRARDRSPCSSQSSHGTPKRRRLGSPLGSPLGPLSPNSAARQSGRRTPPTPRRAGGEAMACDPVAIAAALASMACGQWG